jgi:mRNA-decapping enzyme subunit 2
MDIIPDADDDAHDEENIFRDMTFEEVLEDLNARFLVNLPSEESSMVRVYWQAEQAYVTQRLDPPTAPQRETSRSKMIDVDGADIGSTKITFDPSTLYSLR